MQRPDLTWARIDGFSRKVIWEGREQREAWERSRLFGGEVVRAQCSKPVESSAHAKSHRV